MKAEVKDEFSGLGKNVMYIKIAEFMMYLTSVLDTTEFGSDLEEIEF